MFCTNFSSTLKFTLASVLRVLAPPSVPHAKLVPRSRRLVPAWCGPSLVRGGLPAPGRNHSCGNGTQSLPHWRGGAEGTEQNALWGLYSSFPRAAASPWGHRICGGREEPVWKAARWPHCPPHPPQVQGGEGSPGGPAAEARDLRPPSIGHCAPARCPAAGPERQPTSQACTGLMASCSRD